MKLSLRLHREITSLVEETGTTPYRLAKQAGVDLPSLYNYLNHRTNVSIKWLEKVEAVLSREQARIRRNERAKERRAEKKREQKTQQGNEQRGNQPRMRIVRPYQP